LKTTQPMKIQTLKNSLCLLIGLLLLSINITAAQETPPAPSSSGVDVQIEASDGKTLHGSYFAASDGEGPAVLLLHQLYSNRSSWTPLMQPLLDAGFKVLAVDLRGYGKTKGKIDWKAAQQDTLEWAGWLKGQPGVQSVALVGSSMGSNLALNGCAAVEGCKSAVAISPSLNYFNVTTDDALQAGFPALIIYADRDRYPAADMPKMLELGGERVTTIVYSGRTHGVDLFKEHDELAGQIVEWLKGR
jgi:pimeloyl-ACP methyl ester carboxylesterase